MCSSGGTHYVQRHSIKSMKNLLSLNRRPPLHDFAALWCVHVIFNILTCCAYLRRWSFFPSFSFSLWARRCFLLRGLAWVSLMGLGETTVCGLNDSPVRSLAIHRFDGSTVRSLCRSPFFLARSCSCSPAP
jgi:hypothetical protein